VEQEEINNIVDQSVRRRHRRGDEEQEDKYRKLRQWLNIIFMVGALVGVVAYFTHHETIGIYIILGSMVFKFVECVFRIIK